MKLLALLATLFATALIGVSTASSSSVVDCTRSTPPLPATCFAEAPYLPPPAPKGDGFSDGGDAPSAARPIQAHALVKYWTGSTYANCTTTTSPPCEYYVQTPNGTTHSGSITYPQNTEIPGTWEWSYSSNSWSCCSTLLYFNAYRTGLSTTQAGWVNSWARRACGGGGGYQFSPSISFYMSAQGSALSLYYDNLFIDNSGCFPLKKAH